jgi:2-dehydro-3-deoxygluconokinase
VAHPVGAGDGFAAGVLSGLLDGLSVGDSVARGNAVGAMATLVQGDYEGLPEKAEIERFTQQTVLEDVHR